MKNRDVVTNSLIVVYFIIYKKMLFKLDMPCEYHNSFTQEYPKYMYYIL